jgi:hypothetical protein
MFTLHEPYPCSPLWPEAVVFDYAQKTFYCINYYEERPASWSSSQSFWLLIMRSRVWFPALPWGFFLEGEDSHGDHGLGILVEFRLRSLLVHIHVSPSNASGLRNCASWASQPQKAVTLWPQSGGETAKSIRDMWWHWRRLLWRLYRWYCNTG